MMFRQKGSKKEQLAVQKIFNAIKDWFDLND